MQSLLPAAALVFVASADGLRLPVIDVTHPAFRPSPPYSTRHIFRLTRVTRIFQENVFTKITRGSPFRCGRFGDYNLDKAPPMSRQADALAARYFDRSQKAGLWNRFQSGELFDWNRIFEDLADSFAHPSRPVKKDPKRKR